MNLDGSSTESRLPDNCLRFSEQLTAVVLTAVDDTVAQLALTCIGKVPLCSFFVLVLL